MVTTTPHTDHAENPHPENLQDDDTAVEQPSDPGTEPEAGEVVLTPGVHEAGAQTSPQSEVDSGPETPAEQASDAGDLVREGEIAADFLESLLDIADLDGDLEVDVEGNRAAVAIVDSEDGQAPRSLVGPGGSVLDALQELTRLAVQVETGERSRLMLDVASYRADRRTALVRAAQRAISQVQESGTRQELEPMTAFERKVVHDEVLAAGLHSESEGTEPARFVVISPAS